MSDFKKKNKVCLTKSKFKAGKVQLSSQWSSEFHVSASKHTFGALHNELEIEMRIQEQGGKTNRMSICHVSE